MEKLYNIWPPNARSHNDNSAGPSSFNSNHNMWAVPNKQSNPMSSLWYPQSSDPIPNGLQELWDKPANQLNAQSSQATNLGHQTPTQDSSNRFYQELNSLASGQNRVSETQSSQIPQYNGQVSNRTQIPTSNGNLGGLSQAYGSRFFQGNTNNFNQNGQANPINGLGLSNNGLGAQNGVQNNYGGQAGIQATQAYLQNLQAQAALSKQGSANQQQNFLQAQQQARFNTQNQNRTAFSQANGLQGFNNNNLPISQSQQISQNLGNLNQGLGNLGNLNLSQAYTNELLGQLNLNSNQNLGQNLGGNSNLGGINGLLGGLRNGQTNLQNQQYGLNGNQLFNGGNSLANNQGGLGGNLQNGLLNGNTDISAIRLQQAIQALNLQQSLNSNSSLQNLQNLALQERQRQQLLELWSKQNQSQSSSFAQNQGIRQDQSRFSGQFGIPQRSVNQQNFHQNLGGQSQNQILQQHRLGRSGSPGTFGQNPNLGNRMYQQ